MDDVLDHHRQAMFYSVIGVFHIVATLTVLLRLYTRYFVVRSFGLDDWAIVAALVGNYTPGPTIGQLLIDL